MDDPIGFAMVGVIALPTFLMSCWTRLRRFADLPLPGIAAVLGAAPAYRLGELHRARVLDPQTYWCGTQDYITMMVLLWMGAWVVAAGFILLSIKGTRPVGRRIFLLGAPVYALAVAAGYLIGRYVVST